MTWLNALAIFAVGAAVGALLLYVLLPARRQYGRLMRERDAARKELNEYRRQVDQHFVRTAELVNQLTESYRQVHDHLSSGAHDLCSEAGRRLASDASLDALASEDTSADTSDTGPPLDYAPSARGTLSEDYGLDKKGATPFEPVDDLDNSTEEPDSETATTPRDYADAGDKPEAGDDSTAADRRSG